MEANNDLDTTINSLTISLEEEILARFNVTYKDQDNKQLKKKLKKGQVDPEDNNEKALEKVNKLLDELYRGYQTAGKQVGKVKTFKTQVDGTELQKEKINKNKLMFQSLYNNFKKRYDEEIQKAQDTEKQEENKRKAIIQELQERIKVIQNRYEEAGKAKIEKYKENQTLKHQLSKYEPHLVASESLADAQLKKKSIEIEIQMTTLKQKIQMMDNFKNMRVQTEEKLKKSRENEEKIGKRLGKLQGKQQEHKLSLAKAHLIFQDYRKAFNVLKDTLPKKERDAVLIQQKLKKSNFNLQQQRKKIADLQNDYAKQKNSLQVLLNLQGQLQKQLNE